MLGLFGTYDVVVAGAGVTGVIAAISAARAGAKVLLVEGTGFIGGNVTAGRLTKPTGTVENGIFWEMMKRASDLGGADISVQTTNWGEYTGVFDPETILRVMITMLEEDKVEVLLHTMIVGVVTSDAVKGLEIMVKSGRKILLSDVVIDASGDGDVATLAGAEFAIGRASDGMMQPMSCYIRMVNVDTPSLARYIRDNPDQFKSVVLPPEISDDVSAYAFRLLASGFHGIIERAREAGDWTLPKNYLTVKTGLLPGEINLNITRFQGNALDERAMSRAELEIRKQAYEAVDFVKRYVPGCEEAALLDIAPKLGVRETRRIKGEYTLSGDDVKQGRTFEDAIGFTKSPIDVHEPGGEGGGIVGVADGYSVPYRCLLPANVDGVLIAGRCISVDEIAYGSTRNIPTCALTGEAAGVAASLASQKKITPRQLDVGAVQEVLRVRGVPLRGASGA